MAFPGVSEGRRGGQALASRRSVSCEIQVCQVGALSRKGPDLRTGVRGRMDTWIDM